MLTETLTCHRNSYLPFSKGKLGFRVPAIGILLFYVLGHAWSAACPAAQLLGPSATRMFATCWCLGSSPSRRVSSRLHPPGHKICLFIALNHVSDLLCPSVQAKHLREPWAFATCYHSNVYTVSIFNDLEIFESSVRKRPHLMGGVRTRLRFSRIKKQGILGLREKK